MASSSNNNNNRNLPYGNENLHNEGSPLLGDRTKSEQPASAATNPRRGLAGLPQRRAASDIETAAVAASRTSKSSLLAGPNDQPFLGDAEQHAALAVGATTRSRGSRGGGLQSEADNEALDSLPSEVGTDGCDNENPSPITTTTDTVPTVESDDAVETVLLTESVQTADNLPKPKVRPSTTPIAYVPDLPADVLSEDDAAKDDSNVGPPTQVPFYQDYRNRANWVATLATLFRAWGVCLAYPQVAIMAQGGLLAGTGILAFVDLSHKLDKVATKDDLNALVKNLPTAKVQKKLVATTTNLVVTTTNLVATTTNLVATTNDLVATTNDLVTTMVTLQAAVTTNTKNILLLPTNANIQAIVDQAFENNHKGSTVTNSPLGKAKALLEIYREDLKDVNDFIRPYCAYEQSDQNKAKLAEYKLEVEELESKIRHHKGVVQKLAAAE